jgi:hypothetical protein
LDECPPIRVVALQILSNLPELSQSSFSLRAGRLERPFQALAHVIVYQGFLGAFNRALHGLQLLSNLSARPVLLDHFNDCFEVAVGTFQTSGNRGMRVVHEILLTSWQDIIDPRRRIEKALDSDKGHAYLPSTVAVVVRGKPFNPNEEHMGSTIFGNATPTIVIGLARAQNIKINRASFRRVRGDGRT